jgi:hypothetical protein
MNRPRFLIGVSLVLVVAASTVLILSSPSSSGLNASLRLSPSHCSSHLPPEAPVSSRGDEDLVSGHPNRAQLCVYRLKTNESGEHKLTASVHYSTRHEVLRWKGLFNSLRLRGGGGRVSCPRGTGNRYSMVFGYPDETLLSLVIGEETCGYVASLSGGPWYWESRRLSRVLASIH